MIPKIKICGIRSVEAAKTACEAGADFIGLNFVPDSKRKISIYLAKIILKSIQSDFSLQAVGIFRDQPAEYINKLIEELQLTTVQLHGTESPEYCRNIQANIIKAFSLDSDFDPVSVATEMARYDTKYYLIDKKAQGIGQPLDLQLVSELAKIYPFFLAGGLNVQNVKNVITTTFPFGLDVAGGVETEGHEDVIKIKQFIDTVLN